MIVLGIVANSYNQSSDHCFFNFSMYLKLALSCISFKVSLSKKLFLFYLLSFDESSIILFPSLIES